MTDTVARFTVDLPATDTTTPTHVVHLPVPADRLETAVTALRDLAARPTHTGWLTGQMVGGDSWQEWAEPADPAEDDYVALHVTISAHPGASPWHAGRVLAQVVAPCDMRTFDTLHVTVGGDWSESA